MNYIAKVADIVKCFAPKDVLLYLVISSILRVLKCQFLAIPKNVMHVGFVLGCALILPLKYIKLLEPDIQND